MKKILLIIIGLQLVACVSSVNLTAPRLSYVDTFVANISTNKGEVRYVMRYELTDESPDGLYAQIHYQDLKNNKIFKVTELGALANIKVINFKSRGEHQIINNQYFEIILTLYKDANYTSPVGIHRDLVWFEMPQNVAEILKIKLL
ncbi:MAG: hypothetical protein COA74_08330 [Gammaproteobacteria bacterium]|nr:MAG: hypothetical protein COA74_08330 [Gammaproteobacteria bacterium]